MALPAAPELLGLGPTLVAAGDASGAIEPVLLRVSPAALALTVAPKLLRLRPALMALGEASGAVEVLRRISSATMALTVAPQLLGLGPALVTAGQTSRAIEPVSGTPKAPHSAAPILLGGRPLVHDIQALLAVKGVASYTVVLAAPKPLGLGP